MSCLTSPFFLHKTLLRFYDKIFALLTCYAAYSSNFLPTFRDNLATSSSRVKHSSWRAWRVEMGTIVCPETSVTGHLPWLRNVWFIGWRKPEDTWVFDGTLLNPVVYRSVRFPVNVLKTQPYSFFFFCPVPPHVLVDFVVLPPGHGRSVTDFWGWHAHEAQLRCPDDVSGDTGRYSARRTLKPKFY